MSSKVLRFSTLHERHPGVPEAVGHYFAQAACVCLDRHHTPPAEFSMTDNGISDSASVQWTQTDHRTRIGWANKDDATRDAAYGISLAAVEVARGLVAVGRAETGTGADYYLAQAGEPIEDLETALRLEVSGTDHGDEAVILGRLNQKIKQAKNGNSNLPAMASVVGFASLRIVTADVAETEP